MSNFNIPPFRPESNKDPNFFWIKIPGTSLRVDFDTREIADRSIDYLDEKAEEIYNYISVEGSEEKPILLKLEIPQGVNIYGGCLLFYWQAPDQDPQLFLGDKSNENIIWLDTLFNELSS